MELLSEVSMSEDVPDESGAYIPTQWSAVYNLNEKQLPYALTETMKNLTHSL